MTISPASYDFTVYRNGDVRQNLIVKLDGVEMDLSGGWTARLQVRDSVTNEGDPRIEIDSTTPTANGSEITFVDAVNGEIQIFIDDLDMGDSFPISKARSGSRDYVFDLLLTAPGGDVDPYVKGTFTVLNGVTRDAV